MTDSAARLEAYLARTDPHASSAVVSVATRDACDPDDALRATVRRRIELRLMGHDVFAPRATSSIASERRARAIGHHTLAGEAPDEGESAVTTRTEEDEEDATMDCASGRNAVAATTKTRAADAVLRRLVQELNEERDSDGEEEWKPDGTRWEETPDFLNAATSASAKSLREKYPELWGPDNALGER